eukprot:TRINITY_DN9154_c0_g1_i1.p1 TRINITY_DN9154_c0_g1~~TRINITY_DN9154_c0_g1_i1.p1  ORF type:complete len:304 (+),score=75.12 TRINITY_DN9154_c0_g1_i1:100-912(+)
MDPTKRAKYVQELFDAGMDLRNSKPHKALKKFLEILDLQEDHVEARLKIIWLLLKDKNFRYDFDALMQPVIDSDTATLAQKQRAYTNWSCSISFNPKDKRFNRAEKLAQAGVDLDGIGTHSLFENLGNALRRQGKLSEASDAFQSAVALNPHSSNALARVKSIQNFLDPSKQQRTSNPIDKVLAGKDLSSFRSELNSLRKHRSDGVSETIAEESDDDAYFSSDEDDSYPPLSHRSHADDLPIPASSPAIPYNGTTMLLQAGVLLGYFRRS